MTEGDLKDMALRCRGQEPWMAATLMFDLSAKRAFVTGASSGARADRRRGHDHHQSGAVRRHDRSSPCALIELAPGISKAALRDRTEAHYIEELA